MGENVDSLEMHSGISIPPIIQSHTRSHDDLHIQISTELDLLHVQLQNELKTTGKKSPSINQLVERVMTIDMSLTYKCKEVDAGKLLLMNQQMADNGELKRIVTAVDLLGKYALNLLNPNRNVNWRSISKSNKVFQNKVASLKGHEDVLKKLGYSEDSEHSFDYPFAHHSPDENRVMVITADLIILHHELLALHTNKHPTPDRVMRCFTSPSFVSPTIRKDPILITRNEPISQAHEVAPLQNDATSKKRNFDAIQSPDNSINSLKPEPRPRVLSQKGPETGDNLGPVSSRPVPRPRLGKVSAFVENTQSFHSLNEDSEENSEENSECSDSDTMDTTPSPMSITYVTPKVPPKIDLSQYDSTRFSSSLPMCEEVFPPSETEGGDVIIDREMQRGLLTPAHLLQNAPKSTPFFSEKPSLSQSTSEDDPPSKTSLLDFLKSAGHMGEDASELIPSSLSETQIIGPPQSKPPYRPPGAQVTPLTGLFKDIPPKLPPKPSAELMKPAVPMKEAVPLSLERAPIPTSQPNAAPLPLQTVTETETRKCFMCEDKFATKQCDDCRNGRCDKCDELWHLHPFRRAHQRKQIVVAEEAAEAPPPQKEVVMLPPKECNVCGEMNTTVSCEDCDDFFCDDCDTVFHKHKARKNHIRKMIVRMREQSQAPPSARKDTFSGAIQKTSQGAKPKAPSSKPPMSQPAAKVKTQLKVLSPQEKLQVQINDIVAKDLKILEDLEEVMEKGKSCTNKSISDQYMDEEKILRKQHQKLYEEQITLQEQLVRLKSADVEQSTDRPSAYMDMNREIQTSASTSKDQQVYLPMGENLKMDEDHFAEDALGWKCSHCTFINTNMDYRICDLCCKTSHEPEMIIGSLVKAGPKQPAADPKQAGYVHGVPQHHVPAQLKTSQSQVPPVSDQRHQEEQHLYASIPADANLSKTRQPAALELSRRAREEEEERKKELHQDGMSMIDIIKRCERMGYQVEDVMVAMARESPNNFDPLQWLNKYYGKCVEDVRQKVTREFQHKFHCEGDPKVNLISESEVMNALRERGGHVPDAIFHCTEMLSDKVEELQQLHEVAEVQTVAQALIEAKGNIDQANWILQQKSAMKHQDAIQGILNKLWGDQNQNQLGFKIAYEKTKTAAGLDGNDRMVRMIMAEYDITWGKADMARKLSDRFKDIDDCVVAVGESNGYYLYAVNFLSKKCQVCFDEAPMNKLLTMPYCQCLMCSECFREHFTFLILQDSTCIVKCTCPGCDEPNISEGDPEDIANYFALTASMLKSFLDQEVYNLFESRLRDWNLSKDPKFRWCSHCSAGVINDLEVKKVTCPYCKKHSCYDCKQQWKDQHEGISCENFAEWMEANDPDIQAQGLTAHLQKNGINCPKCKWRYELAKGGCMHFKCVQCKFEFCCGCNKPFGTKCNKYATCAAKGFHAHHPRDCLFYLRDFDVEELQKLLKDNKQNFTTEAKGGDANVCQVLEQKETLDGLKDDKCGEQTIENTGLCRIHYKEYLVVLINRHCIDPLDIFTDDNISAVLMRNETQFRKAQAGEAKPTYRTYLIALVKEQLPLEQKPPKDRANNV